MIKIRRSDERGHANHGWLDSRHSFSFADYYDPAWMGYRSLRVINDDRVEASKGFGTHPHRDMEIITYVLSGSLEHKDSMGNGRILRAGDLQYMSAGSGVRHSEFNPSAHEAAHFLQIWIQPDRTGSAPRYAEKSLVDATEGVFHLITSPTGREDSISIHQDTDLSLARLAPGQSVSYAIRPGRYAWVHLAEGGLTLNGNALAAGDAAIVESETTLEFTATQASQVLLFDLN